MALTNVTGVNGTKQPSAPAFAVKITADLDGSYPAGGYDLSEVAGFKGATIVTSSPVPHWDGAALRWFKLVDDGGTPKLRGFVSTNGAPGVQVTAAVDLSGHTGLTVEGMAQ